MDFFTRQDSKFLDAPSAPRKIKVFRNGDPSIFAEITLRTGISFQQLTLDILHKLGLRVTNNFRLFNSEGLELYGDYIPLIKDQEHLYASLGENFDQTTSLGKLEELQTLGRGGFGKVVLAQHRITKKKFAAKYVDARQYGLASLIDMVFSEAELLKNLKHKNIVEIVNFFKLPDLRVVFLMEYLEGGELGAYLQQKGQLTESEVLGIFRQLVDAVHFCHMNKIIHRDLKLENILFESKNSNVIKVVDFGIAGLYSGYKFDVSDAGSLKYMAPEVITGKNRAANPAIDVWSMGCILYTLLHGETPFNGNKREIIDGIVKGEYRIDPKVKSRVSPECIDLIRGMLVVDSDNRLSTFDIKNHPWLTGETLCATSLATLEAEDEKERKRAAEEKKKEKSSNNLIKKKEVIAPRPLKEKPIPTNNLVSARQRHSNLERIDGKLNTQSFKMPGQNTLKRAVSRENRAVKPEVPGKKIGLDSKIKENTEAKKPLTKRFVSVSMTDTDSYGKGK